MSIIVLANENTKWILVESTLKTKKTYKIHAPYETFKKWAEYNSNKKTVPGFRPGHAPINSFKDDWTAECAKLASAEIIKQDNLKDIWNSTYGIETFEENQEIVLVLNFDIYPEVPSIDFSNITLNEHVAKLSKQDIQQAITGWANTHYLPEILKEKRAAQENDFLNVTIEATENDGNRELLNTLDIQLGKNTLLAEIEQGLIGKNEKEFFEHSFNVNEKSPLASKKEMIGKKISLFITINNIRGSKIYSESDMQKEFSVHSKSELEDKFESMLKLEAREFSEYLLKEDLKHELLKHHFEVPQAMILNKYKTFKQQMLSEIGFEENMDLAKLLEEKMQLSVQEFEQRSVIVAEAFARLEFLLSHLAALSKIDATKDELDKIIAAQAHKFPDGLQGAVKFFNNDKQALENLKKSIVEDKVIKDLLQKVKLTQQEHEANEFYKLKPQQLNSNTISKEYITSEDEDEEDEEPSVQDFVVDKKTVAKKKASKEDDTTEAKKAKSVSEKSKKDDKKK